MGHSIVFLAYLGPETMLPMTSIVAGVVGVVMMFGRTSIRWVTNTAKAVLGSKKPPAVASARSRKIGVGPVGGIVREHASDQAEAKD